MIASRSMAIDTARRNTGLLNQAYFTGVDDAVADTLARRQLLASQRRLHLVQVEPEETAVHLGPETVERVVALLLVVLVPPVVLGLDVVDAIELAGAELQVGGVLIGNDEKDQLVQVRKPLVRPCRRRTSTDSGRAPSLSPGTILDDPPRTARHNLIGRSADVVRRGERARLVGASRGHVSARFPTRPSISASWRTAPASSTTTVSGSGADNSNGLPLSFQQILHRRMQRLVERHLRAEQDVLRGNRMPVRELRAPPKVKRPRQAVCETSHDFASIGTNCCVPLS